MARVLFSATVEPETLRIIDNMCSQTGMSRGQALDFIADPEGAKRFEQIVQNQKLRRAKLTAVLAMLIVWSLTFVSIGLLQSPL